MSEKKTEVGTLNGSYKQYVLVLISTPTQQNITEVGTLNESYNQYVPVLISIPTQTQHCY